MQYLVEAMNAKRATTLLAVLGWVVGTYILVWGYFTLKIAVAAR